MAEKYIDWNHLTYLSNWDRGQISLDDKAHKLGEEYGEFLQALLKYKGAKNVSASADCPDDKTKEHLLEELCEVMNNAMDIINFLGFSNEEVRDMFSAKLNKWESKLSK